MIATLSSLYGRVAGAVERGLDPWFTGLLARFVFAAVLLVYYLNSASTKVGDGLARPMDTTRPRCRFFPTA